MVLIGISQDLARVEGIHASRYNLLYLLCIALVVALGVRIIGGLMTAALVAIPAASSKNISSSLRQYAVLSTLFGGLACVLGIMGAHLTQLAVGPMIIISSSIFFGLSLLIRKK
ncbi:metal ABC transporter permease [Candidatus Dependentiae bacterium]